LRGVIVSVATVGLMVGPPFAHGVFSSVAGAKAECTITGTAADDNLNGTTRDDVICAKAGQDNVNGEEGNDVIRGGQGDDGGGGSPVPCALSRRQSTDPSVCAKVSNGPVALFGLHGGDGSDVVKGQADDDSIEGDGQNDRLYGGQGADCLGADCARATDGYTEPGNDFLKSRDHVSGNDYVDGGDNTDRCVIDAGDEVHSCEQ
jgi:Ca2+-binding RTX toxin-like protein